MGASFLEFSFSFRADEPMMGEQAYEQSNIALFKKLHDLLGHGFVPKGARTGKFGWGVFGEWFAGTEAAATFAALTICR